MKSFLFYASIALAFGSCTGAFHRTPVCRARLPLTPGRIHYYVIREENRTFSEEKGVKVSRENNVSVSLHCKASERGHIKIVLDTLSLHQRSDNRVLDMDAASAIQSPDPTERMLAAFDGAELSAQMDTQGGITLSGLGPVYVRMGALAQDDARRMAGEWERNLDTAFFTSLLEKAWHIYPGGKTVPGSNLALGDSWVLPDSLNADCHIPLDTTYTLESSRHGVLRFTTRAVVDIRDRHLYNTSRQGALTLKGKQVGYIDVDAATGVVLDGKSTLMAKGVLQTGETSIPLIIDSTYTVSAS